MLIRLSITALGLVICLGTSQNNLPDGFDPSRRETAIALEAARLGCMVKHGHRYVSEEQDDPLTSYHVCRNPTFVEVPILCGSKAVGILLLEFEVISLNGQRVNDVFVVDREGAVFSTRDARGFAWFLEEFGPLRCTRDSDFVELAKTHLRLTYARPLEELTVCGTITDREPIGVGCPPITVVSNDSGRRLDVRVTLSGPYHEAPMSVLWNYEVDAEGVFSYSMHGQDVGRQ